MENNECSQCKIRQNAFICFCQEVLLCENCLTFHLLTNPSVAHKPVPLSSYQLMKEMQCEAKTAGSEPEACERQSAREKIESELSRLTEFRTSALEQLRQVREQWLLQINEAADEIEDILKNKCEVMAQDLKQSLDDIAEGKSVPKLPFFSKPPNSDSELLNLSFDVGKMDLNPLFKQFFSVSLNYTQEKQEDKFLYKLFGGQSLLAVFDAASESVVSFHNLSERLFHNSCWVLSPEGDLIITGGSLVGNSRNDVLKYSTTEHTVQKLQSMNKARRSHASLMHNRQVYVFGGNLDDVVLADCEFLSLDSNQWTTMSGMRNPREQLGVAEYQDSAYIAGGCTTAEIEVYSFVKDSFESIMLPGPWLLEGCNMMALDDAVLILHGNYKGEMFLFHPENCSLQKLSDLCHGNSWSSCMPVVLNKTLYVLRTDTVFKIDLETNKSAYCLKITKSSKKRKIEADEE